MLQTQGESRGDAIPEKKPYRSLKRKRSDKHAIEEYTGTISGSSDRHRSPPHDHDRNPQEKSKKRRGTQPRFISNGLGAEVPGGVESGQMEVQTNQIQRSSFFPSSSNFSVVDSHFNSFRDHVSTGNVFINVNSGSRNKETVSVRLPRRHESDNKREIPNVEIKTSRPSTQMRKSSEIYFRHLLILGRGSPLWIPEPSKTLPLDYQKSGIRIGDVGILKDSGGFDFLFNIYLPRNDAKNPINPRTMPDGFSPLDPPEERDLSNHVEFKDRSFLTSSHVHSRHDESSGFVFESCAEDGAIMTMPTGASSIDLDNKAMVRKYVATNARQWYTYANEVRGRDARNGDLRLVIGKTSATTWGMATFTNFEADIGEETASCLKFKPIPSTNGCDGKAASSPRYIWEYSRQAEVKSGPDEHEVEKLREFDRLKGEEGQVEYENQCLFIRTINVAFEDTIRHSNESDVPQLFTTDLGREHSKPENMDVNVQQIVDEIDSKRALIGPRRHPGLVKHDRKLLDITMEYEESDDEEIDSNNERRAWILRRDQATQSSSSSHIRAASTFEARLRGTSRNATDFLNVDPVLDGAAFDMVYEAKSQGRVDVVEDKDPSRPTPTRKQSTSIGPPIYTQQLQANPSFLNLQARSPWHIDLSSRNRDHERLPKPSPAMVVPARLHPTGTGTSSAASSIYNDYRDIVPYSLSPALSQSPPRYRYYFRSSFPTRSSSLQAAGTVKEMGRADEVYGNPHSNVSPGPPRLLTGVAEMPQQQPMSKSILGLPSKLHPTNSETGSAERVHSPRPKRNLKSMAFNSGHRGRGYTDKEPEKTGLGHGNVHGDRGLGGPNRALLEPSESVDTSQPESQPNSEVVIDGSFDLGEVKRDGTDLSGSSHTTGDSGMEKAMTAMTQRSQGSQMVGGLRPRPSRSPSPFGVDTDFGRAGLPLNGDLHPSRIMNQFLLSSVPGATMAITEDEDWISVLQPSDQVFPPDDVLLSRVKEMYEVCVEEGVVFLRRRQQSA